MDFHYFGSTAFNWAIGSTRQEVIDKLAKSAGEESNALKAANVKVTGGLYCWTCKVHATKDVDYGIEYFQPVGVEISDGFECNIVNKNGSVKLIEPKAK